MAETVEGGLYKVGDEWQDANGNKVDAPKGKAVEPEEDGEAEPVRRGSGRPRGA